jgi:hypothetical protein
MLRGSADEEVSTDTSGNVDYESIEESLHATKSVQTDVCMADFDLYKEQQSSVLVTKRLKFEAVIVWRRKLTQLAFECWPLVACSILAMSLSVYGMFAANSFSNVSVSISGTVSCCKKVCSR